MKKFVGNTLMILLAGIASCSSPKHTTEMEKTMYATGNFEVSLEIQPDNKSPAGRMTIDKKYRGDVEGVGVGQMVSKRTKAGPSVYFAIEEFSGTIDGKSGAFTLVHKGFMSSQSEVLEVDILDGSGSGELINISGSMTIIVDDGNHSYELTYSL